MSAPLLSPTRRVYSTWLGAMGLRIPAHPRSWPCASTRRSKAGFCPGDSKELVTEESEVLLEGLQKQSLAFLPQLGSSFSLFANYWYLLN